ncbi:hypothetical protein [Xenorhabdus griffiniae]|uniref:Head decoration protein n=1 Tax=Xenorhabdus griffiniae TaxID=351672 RepID=A0ABY9XM66_9GAMM|nr:hypothetical protein [Xenorhabdus griffiniae]MBD1228321.1 hypothetical protein [Xenorhabdus griffiniae]MBE8587758.1 hypothetical protein [Xenorhabdus griffiniae]WMV74042.1 hypothetical protein QL128_08630 [Xenorhabdus griffiniae]WNH03722.1 hypothetical protein QL112_008635 [Xenorhabdus griffiniae]
MSSVANWAYTAPCTFWKQLGTDEYGRPLGYEAPKIIQCDYQGGLSSKLSGVGTELVAKNTFWTEFADASIGDYILIGESPDPNPVAAGADEIKFTTRYADTFERLADDYVLVTGA